MLEECIYKECRNTDMKYKNRVRSRVSNLKDARNPNLRLNFLCGQVSPARLSNMTSEVSSNSEDDYVLLEIGISQTNVYSNEIVFII